MMQHYRRIMPAAMDDDANGEEVCIVCYSIFQLMVIIYLRLS